MLRHLPLSAVLVLCAHARAQEARFDAGAVAGLNFAELVGDGGHAYFGPNVGVLGTYRFARHGQVSLEMLYSQNGEYILPEFYPALSYGKVRLHHLEIPVHADLLIGLFSREHYYDLRLEVGMAYTELIGFRAFDSDGADVSDLVVYGNRRAMLLQAGAAYHVARRIGLNWRVSLPLRVEGLSWTTAARVHYMFGT